MTCSIGIARYHGRRLSGASASYASLSSSNSRCKEWALMIRPNFLAPIGPDTNSRYVPSGI
jgi:hypothetical protein